MLMLGIGLAFITNGFRHDGLDLYPSKSVSKGPREVSIAEAWGLYRQGKAVFLDARDEYAYDSAHLPGALHVTPETVKKKAVQLKELAKGSTRTLITYCDGEGCGKAMDLALSLEANGISGVAVLPDGWQGWMDAGYPTEEGRH